MAARTRKLTETDAAAWARFAQRIAALPGKNAPATIEAPIPVPALTPPDAPRHGPRSAAAVPARSRTLDVDERPAGVDAASWRRFQRGKLAGARKLDLHGMTAQQAFHAFQAFLHTAQSERSRCVEVVTGRGTGELGGVLRRQFAQWLELPDIRRIVLAAVHPRTSSAMHANAANPGAVRLLLRRPRA